MTSKDSGLTRSAEIELAVRDALKIQAASLRCEREANSRLRAACMWAEAVMSIVEPRSHKDEYLKCLAEIREALSEKRSEVETSDDRLKAALWKYGKHLAACALQGDMMGTAICTCGWARIRETLAPGSAVETTPLPRVVDVVEELEKRGDELSVRAARYIRIKLNTLEHTEKAYRALCQKGLAEESGVNGL